MLIKEIEPITKPGVNLLQQDNTINIIDELIELPLRKACKIFKQKGKNGEKFGEKLIWFVYPTEMDGNIEFSLRIGKYDYDFLKTVLNEEEISKDVRVEEVEEYFINFAECFKNQIIEKEIEDIQER